MSNPNSSSRDTQEQELRSLPTAVGTGRYPTPITDNTLPQQLTETGDIGFSGHLGPIGDAGISEDMHIMTSTILDDYTNTIFTSDTSDIPLNFSVSSLSNSYVLPNYVNHNSNATYSHGAYHNQMYQNEISDPSVLIKSRSHQFRNFVRSISGRAYNLFSKKNHGLHQHEHESKKRVKYWSSKLFEQTEIEIHKLLIFNDHSNDLIESSKDLSWIDIGGVYKVVPIGIDIWSTRGGVLQDNSPDAEIQWGKSFLIFVPSKQLLSKIGNMTIDVCFTNVNEIRIPNTSCKTEGSQTIRRISLDS